MCSCQIHGAISNDQKETDSPHDLDDTTNVFMTRLDMECSDYSSSDDADTNDVDLQRQEVVLHH